MAEEEIIFPPRPLFMVDRGWQRSRKKTRSNPRSIRGDVQSIHVPERTVKATEDSSAIETMSINRNGPQNPQHNKTRPLPGTNFLHYEPAETRKARHRKRIGRPKEGNTRPAAMSDLPQAATSVAPSGRTPASENLWTFGSLVPGSATSLYTIIDPEATAFQGFAHDYPTRIASGMFPISKYVLFESNPIAEIWYPAAIADDLLLHVILFSTALKAHINSEYRTFPDSETLLKVILDRLNNRMRHGEYSDETIGAVSCMALCENALGNHSKWSMHTVGMSEMIRARGGLSSIRTAMQTKIYRASIVGAVDCLSRPCLSRLTRTTKPLYQSVGMGLPKSNLAAALDRIDSKAPFFDAMIDLSFFTQALNYSVENQVTLDPRAYEEDMSCIAYDLLCLSRLKGIARACQLAALVLMQIVMTDRALGKRSSTLISGELRQSLRDLEADDVPTTLVFWVLFLGGLASFETKDVRWYRFRLRRLARHSNIVSWDAAKSVLRQTMWIDCLQDSHGKKLWDEVIESMSTSSD
ncbi:hypothetical protein EDD37DRAFT_103822 [Exophiala viscosa]|uniref:Tachykinin family protein n=1 Tax=Exophiala viscosa TaxID=2486360 RepID=A0AAN6IFX0_9EURO|nr:hypothetical protein EDD36DRAFT_121241 [Exophiala viscosa]KAI1630414.1 hypothetical protein EDD37DRAFT_103822 [Exophiala viscosa]